VQTAQVAPVETPVVESIAAQPGEKEVSEPVVADLVQEAAEEIVAKLDEPEGGGDSEPEAGFLSDGDAADGIVAEEEDEEEEAAE
jgi:hypothetical protein